MKVGRARAVAGAGFFSVKGLVHAYTTFAHTPSGSTHVIGACHLEVATATAVGGPATCTVCLAIAENDAMSHDVA